MTRKDTILVAVVVNAGLLAVLFGAAIIHDPEEGSVEPTTQIAFVEAPAEKIPSSPVMLDPPTSAPVESNWEIPPSPEKKEVAPLPPTFVENGEPAWITIRVKKGDVLEKIAKTHGVSVSAIKKCNQLSSEKLSIGQTLKVPVVKKVETPPVLVAEEEKGAVYYTLKSGDSPWKIAKQHQMTVEELLRLNHIDEEKAKSLQIGDRVRVK